MPAAFAIPAALVQAMIAAKRVVALTGAGVSAESGVPTFRDAQSGLWENYRPEDLATPSAFLRNPRLVWDWYAMRRAQVGSVLPNPAHHALVRLESLVPGFTLVTQNVDGLHRRAGSRRVLELHGNIERVRCFNENCVVATWDDSAERPPRCPNCGGYLRPDVVWFGENLPADALQAAEDAARAADVLLSVGTSAVVFPAAGLIGEALRAGATVVEINPEETPYSTQVQHRFRAPAGLGLPALVTAVWGAPPEGDVPRLHDGPHPGS